ncbi:transmembrane protein 210 isoform X2 [Phascolarctos cinereus]|uniref:Transmembrane protein 210 isoform X2 n=1 Tax=Phascolarctos cinereus TaxID=38626 RepID=A0A6P5JX79_PHACI|nr:transmembrane protein 210 isoform X2 [Phascolarctos cinereus]
MDQPRARTVRSAHSSHPALPRAVHRGWRLDMFPRPQSSSGLVGSIPCLLLLVVSVSSAADSISVDGKRCECGLGLSREALITLLIVLGSVSVSCFSALLLVVFSIIRTKRAITSGFSY